MADTVDIPAWIALFTGLYALGAAIGEFRNPGIWARMVEEFLVSNGLRFLAGIVCIAVGALIYLASPLRPGDWLAMLVTVIGGVMVLEGFLLLAFGEPFMRLSAKLLGTVSRGWSVASALIGIALIVAALIRL